jgi:signal transduction histidine kinase
MHDPLHRDSKATGRRLAEALQEIRERSLEAIEEFESGSPRQADDASSEEKDLPNVTTQGIEDLLDDDLGLREKVEKCSDLRASLVRQWVAAYHTPSLGDVNGLIELNKAIDRSLMESIARSRTRARERRELFLAVLGQDLRTPLGALVMGSEYLVARGESTARDLRIATRIRNSGRRMTDLVNDLLDFSRCRLGEGIPIVRSHTSLEAIGREIVEEVKAAHPECELRFEARGELQGEWDAGRLGQALSNLVENAVLHGASAPVTVTLIGKEDEVVASVHNIGSTIPDGDQQRIFDPFVHGSTTEGTRRPGRGLGLGLYIAREIVRAHGGSIMVSSSAQSGTTFEVHLPREE